MNTIRTWAALVVVMGLALATLSKQAAAKDVGVIDGDTYAAIAYSPSTGKRGYAYNYGSRWGAEKAALANCKADDAKIVAWVNNGFCALAIGSDKDAYGTGYSYGDGANNQYAMRRARAEGEKRTTNVRVVLCVCSTGQFAPYVGG